MYAQAAIDGDEAGVEGHVVRRAGGQTIAGIESLTWRAVFPRLYVARQKHALSAEHARTQTTEDASAATVMQHALGKHVLADPGCGQEDPLGFAILARMLDGRRENNRAREGMGSGAR